MRALEPGGHHAGSTGELWAWAAKEAPAGGAWAGQAVPAIMPKETGILSDIYILGSTVSITSGMIS